MLVALLLQLAFAASTSSLAAAASAPPQAVLDAQARGDITGPARLITPGLASFVQELMKNASVAGLSLAVVRPGARTPTEFGAWGVRSEEGDPVTPGTLFTMASCSKAFLATAMGILMDDFVRGTNATALPAGVGELSWKTRVRDLLPGDWQLQDEWASERANIGDILSHVSGLPRHELSYNATDTPLSVIRTMRHLRPAFELREKWHYNNLMYMAGQHIIAQYSGTSYQKFVTARIFVPLNMSHSTFSRPDALKSGLFSESWSHMGRLIPRPFMEGHGDKLLAGAGAVISSTADVTQWLRILLAARNGPDNSDASGDIPIAALKEPMTGHTLVRGPGQESVTAYGYGWFISSHNGHSLVSHPGGAPGTSTLVSMFPDDKLGVVIFGNTDGKAGVNEAILQRIAQIAFGSSDSRPHQEISRRGADSDADQTGARRAAYMGPRETHACGSDAPDLEDYAGEYSDPGYGSFELCGPASRSANCTQTLDDFRTVDGTKNGTGRAAQLFARWPLAFIFSHLRLSRLAAGCDTFAMAGTSLHTDGFGKNRTPFEAPLWTDDEGVIGEFVRDSEGAVLGFGMSGFIGEATERARWGRDVQERAEVWFEKTT